MVDCSCSQTRVPTDEKDDLTPPPLNTYFKAAMEVLDYLRVVLTPQVVPFVSTVFYKVDIIPGLGLLMRSLSPCLSVSLSLCLSASLSLSLCLCVCVSCLSVEPPTQQNSTQCLRDSALPVQIEAASSLRYLIELDEAEEPVLQVLPDILNEYFRIMQEIGLDEVTF